MIYRLTTGVRSQWRQRLFGMGMILALTVGFPVLAAWVNYEAFTPGPSQVAQDDDSGAVLGESTSSDNEAAHTSTPPPTDTPKPAAKPLKVRTWQPPAQPATPITETTTVEAEPAASATVTPPASSSTPSDTSGVGLEVNTPIVDTTIEVTPDPLLETLGL